MPDCPGCGRHLMRAHRRPLQKILYSDAFRCPKCGYRLNRSRVTLSPTVSFLFSRHTSCVQCGSLNVHRMAKRDRIDSISKSPVTWLFRLSGAPLNKCPTCRLQYYDWRPIERGLARPRE